MTSEQKVVTYAIPCYNSADYMDHCIQSLLDGSQNHLDDVEILIVDDGSTKDNTAQIADAWEQKYPHIIRALHQENAGHGGAVNRGLANARGVYFKVIDSDDWVDVESAKQMLDTLCKFVQRAEPVDMVLCNYVYENVVRGQEVMDYAGLLPVGEVFGWDQIGKFPIDKYILMHSVFYRTQMLYDCNIVLPKHTFYVDNIFVYVPLPHVKTLFYLDVDLYRYFIGRDDQSVNESVMISRIEQQLLITRVMIDAYNLVRDVKNDKLRQYMHNHLLMMMTISSVFSLLSDREDKFELRDEIWDYLKQRNPEIYKDMRHTFFGRGTNLPGKVGEVVTVSMYHIAQRIFKFN